LARRAVDLGARRLAAITPYYNPSGPRGLYSYYQSICAAVPEADVFVYLFEQRTGRAVSPDEFAELATIPGVVGAKVSGQSADRVLGYTAVAPDALIYAGNDRAFADVVAGGGSGVVSGTAGVFPTPWVTMAAALRSGDTDAVAAAQAAIDRASDAFALGGLDHLKAALAEFGLPGGQVRVALDGPDNAALQRIRAVADLLD
jgi:4-hydroxy-tetrahydrodipicolinate synthase